MARSLLAALVMLAAVPAALADPPRTGAAAYGDWHDDAPGVARHITPDAMPPPFASQSVARGPSVVERPAGAALHVPPGFVVDEFASGLDRPRVLRVAPNGDVFLAESGAGRIRVFRAPDGASRPVQAAVFAEDLELPFGIAFWPPGPEPRFVYVAETSRVVRFPYQPGDLRARGPAQVAAADLPSGGGALDARPGVLAGRATAVRFGRVRQQRRHRDGAEGPGAGTCVGRRAWPRRRLGR